MKIILLISLSTIIAYLLGCINAAYFYSILLKRTDIREHGSGNAGSTNILRVYGAKAAIPVFLVDVGKAVLAVRLAIWITDAHPVAILLSALFVIFGHNWPIFLKYRGGKGVASSLGILIALNWKIALIVLGIAILVMIFSKMVSLGSVVGFVLAPFLYWWMDQPLISIITAATLAAIGIFQHRSNFQRMARGEENKISFSKKKEE